MASVYKSKDRVFPTSRQNKENEQRTKIFAQSD